MDSTIIVSLGGQDYHVVRARLGLYLRLEKALGDERKAAGAGDSGAIADALFAYLNLCIPELTRAEFNVLPWQDIVRAFAALTKMNAVERDFAILRVKNPRPSSPVPWDHEDRPRIVWLHMIASAYKWSLAEIENLEVEEAIAFIQEIEFDEQQAREFEHSLSEVAYPYDSASKKSTYRPLHRPAWMVLRRDDRLLKTRIRKDMLPVGRVITLKEQAEGEIKQ